MTCSRCKNRSSALIVDVCVTRNALAERAIQPEHETAAKYSPFRFFLAKFFLLGAVRGRLGSVVGSGEGRVIGQLGRARLAKGYGNLNGGSCIPLKAALQEVSHTLLPPDRFSPPCPYRSASRGSGEVLTIPLSPPSATSFSQASAPATPTPKP
jgi:hypothetical protein